MVAFRFTLLASVLALFSVVHAEPVGTSFTYQGELQQLGNPANGTFDFQFDLYDISIDGIPVGTTVQSDDVIVVDGLFAVELDFGSAAFNGDQLWLEIAVRDGSSAGEFTTLSPRQIVTAAPYALRALEGTIDQFACGDGQIIVYNSSTGDWSCSDLSVSVPDGSITVQQIDTASVQARVSGVCAVGYLVRAINADGSVVCEPDLDTTLSEGQVDAFTANNGYSVGPHTVDTDTTYNPGSGLILTGTTFSVDTSVIQALITGSCEAGYALTGVAEDGSVSCIRLGELVPFKLDRESIGTAVGYNPSITRRGDGFPIISYGDATNKKQKLFICANQLCTSGTPITIDDNDSSWVTSSVAIGADGSPIVVYPTSSGLKFYQCSDANCTNGTASVLDAGITVQVFVRSVILSASGKPLIAYRDTTNNDLNFYRCDSADCSSGSSSILDDSDSNGAVGANLALRNDGNPIISYSDTVNKTVKIFDCFDPTCITGVARTLISTTSTAYWASVVVNNDGLPLVAYTRSSPDNDLNLYSCDDSSCLSGSNRVLDTNGDMRGQVDLAIGLDGKPVISYSENSDSTVKLYVCDNSSCSTGHSQRIIGIGEAQSSAGTATIISSEGNPLVAFQYNGGYLALKACSDAHCIR